LPTNGGHGNGRLFPALDKLPVKQSLILGNGGIQLNCESEDGLVLAELFLDLENERLVFGPEDKVQIKDDGTAAAIRHAIDYMRFRKYYYLNGELEVYDADHETLLGRCDPFIPSQHHANRDCAKHRQRDRGARERSAASRVGTRFYRGERTGPARTKRRAEHVALVLDRVRSSKCASRQIVFGRGGAPSSLHCSC